jgi:lysophospholipase L1-like esterase
MPRAQLRAFLLSAATLAVLAVPCSNLAAQEQPGNVPETKAPPAASAPADTSSAPLTLTVTLPSWQQGASWLEQDRQLLSDFGDLEHFHAADMKLGPPAPHEDRVVFMGDSITAGWHLDQSFPGKPYINRGIGGQTTPQMLLRFRQDVIELHPRVVVILGGTNDVAQNTGPMSPEQIEGDIVSMAELARANGIVPVICSIPPAAAFWWHHGMEPAPIIAAINEWLKNYAAQHHYVYVDYYDAMKDAQGGLPPNLSGDGVHPGPAGHAVMGPLVQAGIEEAMKSSE